MSGQAAFDTLLGSYMKGDVGVGAMLSFVDNGQTPAPAVIQDNVGFDVHQWCSTSKAAPLTSSVPAYTRRSQTPAVQQITAGGSGGSSGGGGGASAVDAFLLDGPHLPDLSMAGLYCLNETLPRRAGVLRAFTAAPPYMVWQCCSSLNGELEWCLGSRDFTVLLRTTQPLGSPASHYPPADALWKKALLSTHVARNLSSALTEQHGRCWDSAGWDMLMNIKVTARPGDAAKADPPSSCAVHPAAQRNFSVPKLHASRYPVNLSALVADGPLWPVPIQMTDYLTAHT